MSKYYTVSYIETKLREGNYIQIAKLACQFGKHKGCSIQKVEEDLKVWVKGLQALGNDYPVIAQMVSVEWLDKGV